MINQNKLIMAMYTNKLFNLPEEQVCQILAKEFGTSTTNIKKTIDDLYQKGTLRTEKGRVFPKREPREQKPAEKNLVLGVIKQDKNGTFWFDPNANNLPQIMLVGTDDVKQAVGKRCCCDVSSRDNKFVANIEQVFGEVDDPISENVAIAFKYGFKKQFEKQVMDEVASTPQTVLPQDYAGRTDMTDVFFMTWDPAGCKDKDDAIYAEQTDFGYKVYVAIADVAHYVKRGTELDKEATRRGNSCYLGNGVYPMLPPELSNGICSLNPNVPRLALVCQIDIDKKGKILKYNFEKAVINVKQSFAYEEAEKVHLNQDGYDKKFAQAKPYVETLYKITDALEKKMTNRGNLTFISYEPEFRFNRENNKVEDVENTGSERSHKVVEEFMILANEATAKFFAEYEIDGVYRVHAKPREQELPKINAELEKYGITQKLTPDNFSYQKVLELIKQHPSAEYLNDIVLRSMRKAKYSPKNEGHFGLASKGYTHFTSPIRRYADTLAHRIISEFLECGKSRETSQHIEYITQHINEQERKAAKAEVESDKYLCCMWAENHTGEVFEGYITKLTSNVVTVRRKGIKLEIPTFMLQNGTAGQYALSPDLTSLKDEKTGVEYTVGQKINFVITDVDKEKYNIYATADCEKYLNTKAKKLQKADDEEQILELMEQTLSQM